MSGATAPVAAPSRPAVHFSPCLPPRGSGPFERVPTPISTVPEPPPARALAEHVSGCAGVRFRIGADGAPQDIEVMADYPVGYGYGETVRKLVANSRWAPRNDLAWHYELKTIHVATPE